MAVEKYAALIKRRSTNLKALKSEWDAFHKALAAARKSLGTAGVKVKEGMQVRNDVQSVVENFRGSWSREAETIITLQSQLKDGKDDLSPDEQEQLEKRIQMSHEQAQRMRAEMNDRVAQWHSAAEESVPLMDGIKAIKL